MKMPEYLGKLHPCRLYPTWLLEETSSFCVLGYNCNHGEKWHLALGGGISQAQRLLPGTVSPPCTRKRFRNTSVCSLVVTKPEGHCRHGEVKARRMNIPGVFRWCSELYSENPSCPKCQQCSSSQLLFFLPSTISSPYATR